MKHYPKWFILFLIVWFGLIGIAIYHSNKAMSECAERGGTPKYIYPTPVCFAPGVLK